MAAPAETTIKNLNGTWVMVSSQAKEGMLLTVENEPLGLTIVLCNRTPPCPTRLTPFWLWYDPFQSNYTHSALQTPFKNPHGNFK